MIWQDTNITDVIYARNFNMPQTHPPQIFWLLLEVTPMKLDIATV
jgi:hypothetical protein